MKKSWGALEELEEKSQAKNDVTRTLMHKILKFFKLKKKKCRDVP